MASPYSSSSSGCSSSASGYKASIACRQCPRCGRSASRQLGNECYCTDCYSLLLLAPGSNRQRSAPAFYTSSSSSWSAATAYTHVEPSRTTSTSRGGSSYGGGEVCARCHSTVYFAERQLGCNGRAYHARCFCCRACEVRLASGSYRSAGGELYCEPCHRRHLGPQGYGYGLGSALRSFPDRL
ncbi:hypothetical protein HPB47_013965 [Ixodes persulcatus]|uniref:Uncharacterized protein n=1 Tax=Ixodes persulcatus TaxID=34615 RepID=A0AC60QXD6_IXOPE|nr:hypothetical protein HPB47_013965 [Ixodes persulcatus]